MPEQKVTFTSKGLNLSGAVKVPDGVKPGERRPAFIVLHGFGSRMNAGECHPALRHARTSSAMSPCASTCRAAARAKARRACCICLDQVQATSDALSSAGAEPEVDPKRIAILGSSFGAAVAIYCGGVDERVAAVVSASGWGHGERKFRGQHPTPEAWTKFTAMLEEGRGIASAPASR